MATPLDVPLLALPDDKLSVRLRLQVQGGVQGPGGVVPNGQDQVPGARD